MKIADRTPFRTENGSIDIMGRAQGTLKYGLTWYARLQAQDVVIPVLEKVFGANFVLLRNVTLPDTDIDLPLVLLGPPGIYLINVIHERGVYRARDDEWGTVVGGKFVPAGINQLQRTVKLARVLQVYLDRAGFKGAASVEPILIAADPGMHIESVRPAARIVMSDALEIFAMSINQSRAVVLGAEVIGNIAQTIINGPKKKAAAAPAVAASTAALPSDSGRDTTDSLFSGSQPQDSNSSFSPDALGFSFDENAQDEHPSQAQRPAARPSSGPQSMPASGSSSSQRGQSSGGQDQDFRSGNFGEADFREAAFRDEEPGADPARPFETQGEHPSDDVSTSAGTGQSVARPASVGKPKAAAGKKKFLGMTLKQLLTLGGILLFWVCLIVAFALYVTFS